MRVFIKQIGKNNFPRIIEWSKLISITGFTQVIIQLVGLFSGILVIRILPTHEYALYTLANTMLGTMIVLADGGIATAVMSQGGRVWMERKKLGAVMVTGLQLRKKFAIMSLPVSLGVLLYLLRHHGASWLFSILIILSIIPTFFMMLQVGILEISPKLRQDVVQLQKIKVGSNIGRLAILCLTIFTLPLAVVALFAASLPQIWANFRTKKISSRYADLRQNVDLAIQKNILKMVWRLLPEAIYYCFSAQIVIWLISVVGSTSSLAQIGALSRLSIVFAFFSVMFTDLIAPRFARLPNIKSILLVRYIQIQFGIILLSACLVGIIWTFSNEILWVLGPNYFGLNKELVLMAISNSLTLFYGASFLLGTYRTWVINPIIFILVSIITTVCTIVIMDTSTLQNIILINITVTLIEILMLTVFNIFKMLKVKNKY